MDEGQEPRAGQSLMPVKLAGVGAYVCLARER